MTSTVGSPCSWLSQVLDGCVGLFYNLCIQLCRIDMKDVGTGQHHALLGDAGHRPVRGRHLEHLPAVLLLYPIWP